MEQNGDTRFTLWCGLESFSTVVFDVGRICSYGFSRPPPSRFFPFSSERSSLLLFKTYLILNNYCLPLSKFAECSHFFFVPMPEIVIRLARLKAGH